MSYATIHTNGNPMTLPPVQPSRKMNPDVKQEWLEALRSGKYKQTDKRLHTDRGFCCLGVLCDLYAAKHGQKWEMHQDDVSSYAFMGERVYMPKKVAQWANIDMFGVIRGAAGTIIDLAALNDAGEPFTEIAKVVEEHL